MKRWLLWRRCGHYAGERKVNDGDDFEDDDDDESRRMLYLDENIHTREGGKSTFDRTGACFE